MNRKRIFRDIFKIMLLLLHFFFKMLSVTAKVPLTEMLISKLTVSDKKNPYIW